MTSPYRKNQESRQLPFRVYGQYIILKKKMFKAIDVCSIGFDTDSNHGFTDYSIGLKNGQSHTHREYTKSNVFSLEEFADALQEAMDNAPVSKD